MKIVEIFTFVFLLILGPISYGNPVDKLKTDSIYNLDATWTSHNNEKKKLRDFLGQQALIAMVYTSCKATCPMITNKMQEIEKSNRKTEKLKIIMVTFDPARDTPEKLKTYSKKMKLRNNWFLLSGNESDIRDLAAVLGVNYKKDAKGEFSHSNIITLLGPDGIIKTQLRSLSEDSKPLIEQVN